MRNHPHDWDVCGSTAPQTPTYHGKPCARCGGTLRYRSGRMCVACQRARADGRATHNEKGAVAINTLYALWYPEEFDRLGQRLSPIE